MLKNQLGFGKSLAIHALTIFYHNDIKGIKADIENIQQEYKCENSFLRKLYLKVQRTEINNIMIRSVLYSLSHPKQQLIEEKYKNGRTWIAISMLLYTSKAQLYIWHNEILDDIANSMLYKILPENIFSREKVLNMIHILDQQIDFLEKIYKDLVDKDILQVLKKKKRCFTDLYEDMAEQVYITAGLKNKILLKKMEFNNATSQQIACLCGVSEASVSYCLANFREKILEKRKYQELLA